VKLVPRLALTISLCASVAISGIITGVSVIINDQPITLYEVYKYSGKYNISKKEALDILIRQKLEDAQIKKFRISADTFEVDQYIDNLATKSNLSQYEFLNALKAKNINIDDYRADVKTKIKRDKLYREIFADKPGSIEQSALKTFYKENPAQFQSADSFSVSVYVGSEENLKAITQNPMLRPEGVTVEEKIISSATLDNKLKSLLNSTDDRAFTQILNIHNTPTMFYMKEKSGVSVLPYEKVKDSIFSFLSNKKEQEIINNYFEKIKASASIKVLRSPM
jgi:parvulin-like peptidyl-prolyl isomerase